MTPFNLLATMEKINPLEAACIPASVIPKNSIASGRTSRTPSRNYAEIRTSDDSEVYNDTAASSTTPRPNSFLLDNSHQATLENISLNNTGYSNASEKYETEQYSLESGVVRKSLQTRSRFQNVRDIVVTFWLWEVAACVISLICLAAIVATLVYEDGKLLDQWEWSVPPTVVVSFIGTLSKASLVLVLSQVLSQLKWLHFHFRDAKSLRQVRIFDAASRGPLGAVQVIWNSKKLLASFAAGLMILTIVVDPFIQLVFTFPSKLVEDDSQQALFYRSSYWNDSTSLLNGFSQPLPSQRMVSSINEGLALINGSITATCPSGNCFWPEPIKTLGVCGSCSDVTQDIKVNCFLSSNNTQEVRSSGNLTGMETITIVTCNYTYNDGTTLQAHSWTTTSISEDDTGYSSNGTGYSFNDTGYSFDRTMWNSTIPDAHYTMYLSNITISPPSTETTIELDGHPIIPQPVFPNDKTTSNSSAPHAVFAQSILYFDAIQLPAANASERFDPMNMPAARCWNCEIYWCEKSFEDVRITDNAPPTYTVSTQRLWYYQLNDDSMLGLLPSEMSNLNETIWNFRYQMEGGLGGYFTAFINSFFVQDSYSGFGGVSPDSGVSEQLMQEDLSSNTEAILSLVLSKDLNATIYGVTNTLSETIRTGPNATRVVGQNFVNKSFIHVRWAWLALPLSLVVATCILLLIVATRSHSDKVAIWKDDPLALLFHSVSGTDILPGGDHKTRTSDLDNLADEVYVRLDQDTPFKFIVSKKKA